MDKESPTCIQFVPELSIFLKEMKVKFYEMSNLSFIHKRDMISSFLRSRVRNAHCVS